MDAASIATTAAISGLVQAAIGLVFYKLIERQDAKLDVLADRVQTLEDQKIGRIEERLKDGSAEFDALHDEQKDNIRRRDFVLHQEACAGRFAGIEAAQSELARKVGAIAEDVSGIRSVVNLIASRLSITLPKG